MRFRRFGRDNPLPALQITRQLASKLLTAGGLSSLDDLQSGIDLKGMNSSAIAKGVTVKGNVDIMSARRSRVNVGIWINVSVSTGSTRCETCSLKSSVR